MGVTQHYIVTIQITVVISRYGAFRYHRTIARIDIGILYGRSKWKQILRKIMRIEIFENFASVWNRNEFNFYSKELITMSTLVDARMSSIKGTWRR